jgi:hypothetical protein
MNNSHWMKRAALLLSLLIIPTMALAQAGASTGSSGVNPSVNGRGGTSTYRAINPVPVLIYTVWGLDPSSTSVSGVSASSDVSTLVIYDNGLATWGQSNADGSNTSGCSGNCLDTIQLSTAQVNQLVQQLRRAGAFRQVSNNDSPTSSDTSLTTVTVFSNIQNATSTAQTFSFYTPRPSGAAIQSVFSSFFSSNFGSSSINGSGGS